MLSSNYWKVVLGSDLDEKGMYVAGRYMYRSQQNIVENVYICMRIYYTNIIVVHDENVKVKVIYKVLSCLLVCKAFQGAADSISAEHLIVIPVTVVS